MVLKAVPIYTSDQSDDLRLAPKARLVGRSASGPYRTFVNCAANGRFEPSAEVLNIRCMRTQHKNCCNGQEVDIAMQRTNQPFVQLAAKERPSCTRLEYQWLLGPPYRNVKNLICL